MLKKYFAIAVILLFFASCNNTTDNTVGSSTDTQINSLSFTVDTTYLDSGAKRLVARGKVKNIGQNNVTSPWYVEGQFYTDDSYTTKLGGNYTQVGVPISQGQQTFWTIYFSSSNVDVLKYPNFRIGNLRGIYKN